MPDTGYRFSTGVSLPSFDRYNKGYLFCGGCIIQIIIDGYNLIGIHHRNIEAQRKSLIESLVRYRKDRGHEIILVFDGWKNGPGRETKTVTGGITVIYSGIGERADTVIKRILSRQRKKTVVVSSDREIVSFAWSVSCVPVPSDMFYDIAVERREGPHEEFVGGDSFSEEIRHSKKGSPRKLSKKRKEVQRVLEKL